ncbi:Polynucleotide 5'-hydroxyl-kinase nol9 [Allomyces arbusculus]|nr:Polynucleotide 5'-hydroxyl-kinase nol9 [Allomyces arbusculus]
MAYHPVQHDQMSDGDFLGFTTVSLEEANVVGDEEVTLIGFKHKETFVFQGHALIAAVAGSFSVANFLMAAHPAWLSLHPCFGPSAYSLPVIQAIDYAIPYPADLRAPFRSSRVQNVPLKTSKLGKKVQRLARKLASKGVYDAILAVVDFSWAGFNVIHPIAAEFQVFEPRDKDKRAALAGAPQVTAHTLIPVPRVYPILHPSPQAMTVYAPASWQSAFQAVFLAFSAFKHVDMLNLAFYPTAMAIGAKGHGKSTLNRMLVNVLLSTFSQVAFLDMDPGQAEFTEPGVLGLTVVDFPVLGPGYLYRPARPLLAEQFLGAVTPQACPDIYLQHVRTLVAAYRAYAAEAWAKERRVVPLVVNTLGWVRGFGFELLKEALAEVAPTHVLHLVGAADRDQIPVHELLEPWLSVAAAASAGASVPDGDVASSSPVPTEDGGGENEDAMVIVDEDQDGDDVDVEDSTASPPPAAVVPFVPQVIDVASITMSLRPRLNASDLRIFAQSVALCSRTASLEVPRRAWLDPTPLTSPKYPTYAISLSKLVVATPYHEIATADLLYALNGSLVGLGVVTDPAIASPAHAGFQHVPFMPDHHYVGFGIVRAIGAGNGAERDVYVLTSVDAARLDHVDLLIRGDMDVSNWLVTWGLPFVSATKPPGPYLTYAQGEGVGAVATRLRRGMARKVHA